MIQEPGRLWQRYVFLNPAYLTLLALQSLGIWQGAKAPPQAIRFLRYG
jgi:hypothetical protein